MIKPRKVSDNSEECNAVQHTQNKRKRTEIGAVTCFVKLARRNALRQIVDVTEKAMRAALIQGIISKFWNNKAFFVAVY